MAIYAWDWACECRYVGDGSRFSKPEQLMNYAGLVPKLNQSGITNIHGKVIKKGMQVCKAEYNPGSLFHPQSEIQPDMSPFKVRIPQKEGTDLSWQGGCGQRTTIY